MNDAALKSFCIWARNELRQQVAQQARAFGITEEGYVSASADSIDGLLLTNEQRNQRASLISSFLEGADDGYAERYEAMVEQAAYTWFNRLAAIRFMEVNDRLFSWVRMLSSAGGTFEPQVLKEALEVDIEGVDHAQVADLLAEGDDEALFRYLFLAQCSELAKYMPEVFEPIGSAMELLLPQNLLRHGSVVERMVCDIPEEDWREGVEIVGWMYQYYNAELKDEVFASFKKGKKADAAAMKPATQLFTPNWIVRYLVENSLGRLWMQGHPDSKLTESMPYYIPDAVEDDDAASSGLASGHESLGDAPVSSPEEISVVDPACGSGHILVFAFELLGLIYEEAGYVRRDIPQLILQKNLSGIEIDPRAAQWTAFALYMKGCDYDSRFLNRGVHPNVTVLKPVSMEQEELSLVPHLEDRAKLLDAMAHMGECGSLFVPEEADMVALKDAEAQLTEHTDMFSDKALQKVRQMIVNCEPLIRTYGIVVANPPYMGSSNMDKWLANWTTKNYPDVKGDLFSCFIVRNLEFADEGGQLGFMTPYVWMFIGTYEKLRLKIMKEATITSLIQLEYSGFAGATVPICTFTLQKGKVEGYRGGYVRLSDFVGAANQAPKALEAIANPDCGWFYRRDASTFSAIPGSPIAYWASDGLFLAFEKLLPLSSNAKVRVGLQTSDNARWLRLWHECTINKSEFSCTTSVEASKNERVWYPHNKGGAYRRWYGNSEYVINYKNNGEGLRKTDGASIVPSDLAFLSALTCSRITSGTLAFRIQPVGMIYDSAAVNIYLEEKKLKSVLGMLNSTVFSAFLQFLVPTLNAQPGDISKLPIAELSTVENESIAQYVNSCIDLSKFDWDSFETSWDFKCHPMI